MGKYTALNQAIYSVFGSTEWKAENLKTVPSDFTGKSVGTEYLRVTILSSGKQQANPLKSVSGILMVEIFTPAGKGPTRANLIADKLDTYLAGQTIQPPLGGSIQFGSSNLSDRGLDKANPSLTMTLYSITFNYFGA
jgi:hypothetical protein